ncbi:MAG: hypothetical protein JXO44_13625, partial [Clostridia bacterium]|nr:hypothetical protein [Clostridia bacterium]
MHTSEGKINAETYDCLTTLPPVLNVLEATVNNGAVKGGTYIIGPEESPVVTITPWLHLPEIIEKSNPGASRENFWTFFFPDMFPVWDSWIAENSAIEKTNTITIFKPWWDKDRTRNYGAVAMDYSIENINNSVSNVKIRNSGFAFIILENGDILGLTPDAIDILELSPHVFEKNTADYISLNLGSSSNYAIHIDVISDDHIGDLAHSFNHMALEVKESY